MTANLLQNTATQPVCGPCTQARGDVVRHAEPCEESVYEIRLRRVQADLANLQEDLRACITEARATHRVTEAQVLAEVLTNIEQEARVVLGDGFSLAARAGDRDAPAHFSGGVEL